MTDSAGAILVGRPGGSQTGVDAAAAGYNTNSRTNETGVKVRRAATLVAAVGVSVGLLSACGGSSTPAPSTSPAAPTTAVPATSSAAAPSSAVAPATSSVAPATTTATSPAATPTSKFESDDAMKALRAWAVQVAKAINANDFNGAALTSLEYPSYVSQVAKYNFADDVKAHAQYPGPWPFTPIATKSYSATRVDYSVCFLGSGFQLDPKTGKPTGRVKVVAGTAQMIVQNGTWRIGGLVPPKPTFSCTGVNITEAKF